MRSINVRLLAAVAVLSGIVPASLGAGEKWPDEVQAGQFSCHADFSLVGHRGLLEELRLLQQDISDLLETPPPTEPVHLFLFEKKSTYQAYVKTYFPRVPYRRALFIKGRGPGMVFAYQGLDFEVDVRHECTHAVLHASLVNVPLWLDEGLAEYFEPPRERRAEGNPHHRATHDLVNSGRLPRLEELELISDLKGMGREEYRDAWAWVHFLLHGPPEFRQELVRYLEDIQSGGQGESLSKRLRRRFPDLDRRMAEHFLARNQ